MSFICLPPTPNPLHGCFSHSFHRPLHNSLYTAAPLTKHIQLLTYLYQCTWCFVDYLWSGETFKRSRGMFHAIFTLTQLVFVWFQSVLGEEEGGGKCICGTWIASFSLVGGGGMSVWVQVKTDRSLRRLLVFPGPATVLVNPGINPEWNIVHQSLLKHVERGGDSGSHAHFGGRIYQCFFIV